MLALLAITHAVGQVTISGGARLTGQIRLAGNPPPTFRLSGDGLYLINPSGNPAFLNGDTAWSLIVQPTYSEAQQYLDDRAAKGYNVLIVNLIDVAFGDNAPANANGDAPFTTPGDFTTPNSAYFAHADAVIAYAATKGITLLLAPLYLGYQCGSEGWCSAVAAASNADMLSYGQFIGQRYQNTPNIIWLIGGDADPVAEGVSGKVAQMVTGIKQYDTAHLMSAHNAPEQSAMAVWGAVSWLNLNNIYTYDSTTSTKTKTEYDRAGALPFFFLESAYENEHSSTALSLRRQAYQSVLWGARLGHFFGNCPIWHFNGGLGDTFCSAGTWQSNLNSTASQQLALVGSLMNSRRHHLMRPDHSGTVLTAGASSGTSLATTSRATDGSSIISYIPTQRQVTIDMTEVSGSTARAWWWNPRTGATTLINTFATSGSQNFTPPDTNDWALVIDDDSIGFGEPGQ